MESKESTVKKAIFIWQMSPVFAQGIVQGGKNKAVKFCKKLQGRIDEEDLHWQIEVDDTDADIYEILEKNYDFWIFIPGGKTRFYIPRTLREEIKKVSLFYLDTMEYHNMDVTKVVSAMRAIDGGN